MRSKSRTGKDDARARLRAYLAALPPPARRHLRTLQKAIRAAAPRVEDAFSYSIPAFRLDGRLFVWYAAWKTHASLYPINPSLVTRVAGAGHGYETSKGTIRFPLDTPIRVGLVKRLVRAKVMESREKPARSSRKRER